MKLLIHGAQTQSGQALIQLLQSQGVDHFVPEPARASPGDACAAQDLLRESEATQAVNLTFEPVFSADDSAVETPGRDSLKTTEALAEACEAQGLPLIHLSSLTVFDGRKPQPYREDDDPDPISAFGKAALKSEQRVAKLCREHVIVRTDSLFSAGNAAALATYIEACRQGGGRIEVRQRRFSPTPASDLARVLLALAWQLDCDAMAWGIFHYCARPAVNEEQFVEDLIRAAAGRDGTLAGIADKLVVAGGKPGADIPANRVGDCGKIMATFGIKQRAWKAGIDEVLAALYPE